MKKRDLLSLHNALKLIEGRQFAVKFSYFMAKNKVLLNNEISALDEVRKPADEFVKFDTARAELAHKYADRDEKGQPKIENNNFIIIEKVDEFKQLLDDLKDSNKKVIEAHDLKMKDFAEILDQDADFTGPKIDLKDIPQNIEPVFLEVLITADLIIDDDGPDLKVVK